MPPLGPTSRRALVAHLRRLGFEGPYEGGQHEYMLRGNRRLWIPNPPGSDISLPLLRRLLAQAGINREEWEAL